MIALSKRAVYRKLDQFLPNWRESGGWTYNRFCDAPFLCHAGDVPFDALIDTTLSIISEIRLPEHELLFYHDGLAGWRATKKSIRGFRIETVDEIRLLLSEQLFFRDPRGFSENYNLIDESGLWMITFSHEKKWFFFHRSEEVFDRLKTKYD